MLTPKVRAVTLLIGWYTSGLSSMAGMARSSTDTPGLGILAPDRYSLCLYSFRADADERWGLVRALMGAGGHGQAQGCTQGAPS